MDNKNKNYVLSRACRERVYPELSLP